MTRTVDIQSDIAAVQSRIAQITGASAPASPGIAPSGDAFASVLAKALNPNAATSALGQPGLPTATPTASALDQTAAPAGAFIWPASGPISSPFGARKDPFGGGYDFHPGIDIAAEQGSPIRAAAAGRVVQVGDEGGYGNVVVIDHGNGVTSRYAHCSQTFATVGETVSAGDEIAAVGSTGHSTGPHLHFEVRVADKPVDPATFLK